MDSQDGTEGEQSRSEDSRYLPDGGKEEVETDEPLETVEVEQEWDTGDDTDSSDLEAESTDDTDAGATSATTDSSEETEEDGNQGNKTPEQCIALTYSGPRCKNDASDDGFFCHVDDHNLTDVDEVAAGWQITDGTVEPGPEPEDDEAEAEDEDEDEEDDEEEQLSPEEKEARTLRLDYSEFIIPEELSSFQRDILDILYAEGSLIGIKVKEALDELYDDDINHGQLYPNLDELNDIGVINKDDLDERTNRYTMSKWGKLIVEKHMEFKNASLEAKNNN